MSQLLADAQQFLRDVGYAEWRGRASAVEALMPPFNHNYSLGLIPFTELDQAVQRAAAQEAAQSSASGLPELTLRDLFAMASLVGQVGAAAHHGLVLPAQADVAYRMAEAMLVRRQTPAGAEV